MDKQNPDQKPLDELLNRKKDLLSLFSAFEDRIDHKISNLSHQKTDDKSKNVASTSIDTIDHDAVDAIIPIPSEDEEDRFADDLFTQALSKVTDTKERPKDVMPGYHTEEILNIEEALAADKNEKSLEIPHFINQQPIEMIPKETSEPLTVNLKEEATPIQEDICIEKDVCVEEDVCAEEDVCVEEEHYDFDVPATPRVDNPTLSAAEKLPDEAEEIVDDSDYDRWAPTRNAFKSSPIGTALKRKSKKNAEPKADCDPIKNTIAPSETTEIESEDLPATQASTQNPVDETLQEDLLQDDSTQESLFEEDENEENIDVVEESTLEPAEIKMPKSTIVPKAARENFNNDPLFGVPSTEHDEKRFKSFFDEFDHHKDDDFLKDFDLEDDETANADPAPSFYNPVDTNESSETETNLSDKKYDAIFQDDDDLDDSDLLDDEEFYFDDEDAFPDEDDDDQETFQEIITNTDLNEDSKEIYSDNNLDDVTYENVEAVDLGAYKFSAVAVRLSLFIFTMLALGVFTSLSGGTFINLDYLVLFILCIGIALTIDMSFNATLISSVVLMLVFFIGTLFTYFTSKEPLSLYHMLWLIIIPLSMCSASALVQKVKEIILANQLLNEELDQLYSDDDPEEAPIEKSSDLPIEEDAATEIKDQQESL